MITFSREKEISCALIFLKLIHFSLFLPPSISWPPDNHFNAFAYFQLWDNVFWPRPWPWVRIERRAVLSGITCFSFYFLKTPRLGRDAVLKLYQCVLLFSRRTREYKLTSLPNLLFLFSLGGSREDSPPPPRAFWLTEAYLPRGCATLRGCLSSQQRLQEFSPTRCRVTAHSKAFSLLPIQRSNWRNKRLYLSVRSQKVVL